MAVTLALSAGIAPAFAQQQPTAPRATDIDACYAEAGEDEAKLSECDAKANAVSAVVSTGSRIRGLPEDAALPVETITREDLLEQGNPTIIDMIKTLSEIGSVQGESNRGATGYGNASVNLRGLGSGRTLALVNGRRLADAPTESAATSGNFQDISSVPSAALQQVEILKDGGTTAYGADAVAGVVNFITRRDLNGTEINGSFRFVDGADGGGDPDFNILWGRRNDVGNVLLGFSYQGRGELRASERSFAVQEPFRQGLKSVADSPWIADPNPGAFFVQLRTAGTGITATTDLFGFRSINNAATAATNPAIFAYNGRGTDNVFSTISNPNALGVGVSAGGLMRDQGCDELGGARGFATTASPICYQNRAYVDNIVDETHNYQIFGDANLRVNDKVQYHTEFSMRRQLIDVVQGVTDGINKGSCEPLPSTAPSRPVTGVDNQNRGRDCFLNQATTTTSPSSGFSVPGYNPAIGDYFGRFYSLNGAARGLTEAQYEALVGLPSTFTFPTSGPPGGYALSAVPTIGQDGANLTGGRIFLTTTTWTPFGLGGNPATGDGRDHLMVDNYSFRTTQELKVDFGKVFGMTIDMNISGTYQRELQLRQDRGILVDRLQRALNGFATNLDDADGDTCTSLETRGPRTYDYDGTGPMVAQTVQGVSYTVGAGGGAGNAANGFDVPTNTGVDPDGTGPLATGSQAWVGNGCYFFNPFSTAVSHNPFQDFTNPAAGPNTMGFVGGAENGGTFGDYQGYATGFGLANAPGIARWLYEDRHQRRVSDNIFFDLAFNGDFGGLSLPGGPLGWAAGSQWRYVRRETAYDNLSNRANNPCTFRTAAADSVFQPSISGTAANDQLRREDSSTCIASANGPWLDGSSQAGGNNSYRQTRTVAVFAEVAAPLTENVTSQIAYRWEQENQNSTTGEGVGIFSGSAKWQITPNFSLRASAGETFDPTPIPDFAYTQNINQDVFGATVSVPTGSVNNLNPNSETISFSNVTIGPETGFNYNVGLIWQTPDRRLFATIDYFNIEINGTPSGVAAADVLRAVTGIQTGAIPVDTIIDCTTPAAIAFFGEEQAGLDLGDGPRPVIQYRDSQGQRFSGCRPGTNLAGDPATGQALSIAFLNQINAGTTRAAGVDGRLTYTHPDQIWGGRGSVTLDVTYNSQRFAEESFLYGVVIDEADNLLGRTTGLQYNFWRGGVTFNYVKGRHAINWLTRTTSSLRSIATAPTVGAAVSPAFNYNPEASLRGLCADAFNPLVLGGGDVSPVLGPGGVGEGNYDASCNVPRNEGGKLPQTFLTNVTYRVSFPENRASAYVTVDNLFDTDPPFYGTGFGYDSSGGIGALGRTIKLGFSKTY